MSKLEELTFVAEELVEVRYRPSAKFIDVTGAVASYFSDNLKMFPHWTIQDNLVKFQDQDGEPKQLSAFVSYKNAGYVCTDAATQNYFSDNAASFCKALLKNPDFSVPEATRIGVRNKCFIKSTKSFDEVRLEMANTVFKKSLPELIGGTSKDFQAIFEYEKDDYQCRLIVGPLKENEANKHFKFKSAHFEFSGYFIDIDIYKEEEGLDPVGFIRKVSPITWNTISSIHDLFGK